MHNLIQYVRGDATAPITLPAHIVHVVNDCRKWGKGFVLALSAKWWAPELAYQNAPSLELGTCSSAGVEPGVTVFNMTAQHGIYSPGSPFHQNQPLVYDALYRCLKTAAESAKAAGASLHMPKIGTGLAKGDWSIIEKIIKSVCYDYQVNAYVYIR